MAVQVQVAELEQDLVAPDPEEAVEELGQVEVQAESAALAE